MSHDKGTVGLNLFLSLIVSLFVIGLIVMIFSLMGGGLIAASYTSTGVSPTGEVLTNVNNVSATSFAAASLQDASCSSTVFYNQTGGETILAGNYTVSGCTVIAASGVSQTFTATDDLLENVTNLTAVNYDVSTYTSVVCSASVLYNNTNGATILAGNYTISGCSAIAANRREVATAVTYETLENVTNLTGVNLVNSVKPEAVCTAVTVYNETGQTLIIATGNYTMTNCTIFGVGGAGPGLMVNYINNAYNWSINYTVTYNTTSEFDGYNWSANYTYVYPTASAYNGTNWLVNYTYTFNADNDATRTMGNATAAIGTSIDWFDIFIVIGAMVVLILLTVIIIAAIRGSGLIEGGGSRGGLEGTA